MTKEINVSCRNIIIIIIIIIMIRVKILVCSKHFGRD
jgi:hypothetical protein